MDIPIRTIKKWDLQVKKWIGGKRYRRFFNSIFYTKKKMGGWGVPNLEQYYEATQLRKFLELEYEKNKSWTNIESSINHLMYHSLLYSKLPIKMTKNLINPLQTTLKIWNKWSKYFHISKDRYPIGVINNQGQFDKIINYFYTNNIITIRQFMEQLNGNLDKEARTSMWLEYFGLNQAIKEFMKEGVTSETIQQEKERISLDGIIDKIINQEKLGIGSLYELLISIKYKAQDKYVKWWAQELSLSEKEILTWAKSIAKISHMGIWEQQLKMISKWYLTPVKLHQMFQTTDICWHCNKSKGSYIHLWWSCELIQSFWTKIINYIAEWLELDNITISPKLCITYNIDRIENRLPSDTEYVLKTLLRCATRTVVGGWKDSKEWTLDKWIIHIKDCIVFDITLDLTPNLQKKRKDLGRRTTWEYFFTRQLNNSNINPSFRRLSDWFWKIY